MTLQTGGIINQYRLEDSEFFFGFLGKHGRLDAFLEIVFPLLDHLGFELVGSVIHVPIQIGDSPENQSMFLGDLGLELWGELGTDIDGVLRTFGAYGLHKLTLQLPSEVFEKFESLGLFLFFVEGVAPGKAKNCESEDSDFGSCVHFASLGMEAGALYSVFRQCL